jgi:hypothetical protein
VTSKESKFPGQPQNESQQWEHTGSRDKALGKPIKHSHTAATLISAWESEWPDQIKGNQPQNQKMWKTQFQHPHKMTEYRCKSNISLYLRKSPLSAAKCIRAEGAFNYRRVSLGSEQKGAPAAAAWQRPLLHRSAA